MSRFFEQHEFLEFFDTSEAINEDIGWYKYSITLENDFVFNLSLITLENQLSFTLNNKKILNSIFYIKFNGIVKVSLEKTSTATFLNLYKENQKNHFKDDASPYLRIMIKPSVSLELDL